MVILRNIIIFLGINNGELKMIYFKFFIKEKLKIMFYFYFQIILMYKIEKNLILHIDIIEGKDFLDT